MVAILNFIWNVYSQKVVTISVSYEEASLKIIVSASTKLRDIYELVGDLFGKKAGTSSLISLIGQGMLVSESQIISEEGTVSSKHISDAENLVWNTEVLISNPDL